MYPLYRHFTDKLRAEKAYRNMLGTKGGSVHNLLGLMASNIPSIIHFKYCNECNAESMLKRGELYFSRLHQLSTVLFCPIHETPLMESGIGAKQYNRHKFIYPDYSLMRVGVLRSYERTDKPNLIKSAKIHKALIEGEVDLYGRDFRAVYMSLLHERGFLRGNCTVDNIKLISVFRSYFGDSLLASLYSSNVSEWLPAIIRKHRKAFHPVRHILTIMFLCESLKEFVNYKTEYAIPNSAIIGCRVTGVMPYRNAWLHLRKGYPEKSKNALRKLSLKTYTWLYRNDREWLDNNSPSKPSLIIANNRIDWEQRDSLIFREVQTAVSIIKSSESPYLRITAGRIGKMIGKLNIIEKHIDKLPETKKMLLREIESVEQFQKRKIRSVISNMIKEGKPLHESYIYRRASIAKGRIAAVDQYISDVLDHSIKKKLEGLIS